MTIFLEFGSILLDAGSAPAHDAETPYRLYAGRPATIERGYDADLAWLDRTVEEMAESKRVTPGILRLPRRVISPIFRRWLRGANQSR